MQNKYNMSIEDNIFFAKRKLVDNVYKSAKMEGIGVTFAQTEDIFNNVAVSNLRPDEIITILNLKNAWHYIFDTIDEEISIEYIKKVHLEIASGIIRPAGEFRDRGVGISGTDWRPKLPFEVDYDEELKNILNNDNKLDRCLSLFLWIQRSQMFIDGNKRTANLVVNHELIKNGLGILAIPIDLQGKFKEKLVEYYETNDMKNIYETNDMKNIKEWLYKNCLDGIE